MTAHSNLGASKAYLWENCPGWYEGFMALPEAERNTSGLAADEGTAAHTLGEYAISKGVSTAREFEGKKVKAFLQSWPVTREMADAIDMWHDSVRDHVSRLEKKYPGEKVTVLLEQRVFPLADRKEEIFGTGDALIFVPREIVCQDFKYGVGVVVEIENNRQLMFYGLGSLREHAPDAEIVTLEIVQPRAKHEDGCIRSWELSGDQMRDHESTLESAVVRAKTPGEPRIAGDWCRPFCPMALRCNALDAHATSIAVSDFEALPREHEVETKHVVMPDLTDPAQLARAMKLVPLVKFWAGKVTEAAEELALKGVEVEGFKLVRKKANRKWDDEADVERRLRNKGVKVGDIFNMKLRSPAQIEKLEEISKPWAAKFWHKPEGGLTLVAESDKRKALKPGVLEDFQALPDDPAE